MEIISENQNDFMNERYDLTIERIKMIIDEETTAERFRDYFRTVARFILEIDQILNRIHKKPTEDCTVEELKEENQKIYKDILENNYQKSYANPSYAVERLGDEVGKLLSLLYTEIRGEIAYVYENRISYLTICNELFIEIYNCFEGVENPNYKELKGIVYWFVNDYCDVFLADHIKQQLDPKSSFAVDIILSSDLTDLRYLYKFGEYVSEIEWNTAQYLRLLSEEKIDRIAQSYIEGYREEFKQAGIDLSSKKIVDIQYRVGFERVVKKIIEKFKMMGLEVTIYRAAVSVITKKQNLTPGFCGTPANKQYEYDHRNDQGLFLNKKLVERKLEVIKNTYEQYKELAAKHACSMVIETTEQKKILPEKNETAIALTEKQEELTALYDSKTEQLTNKYLLQEVKSGIVDIHSGD